MTAPAHELLLACSRVDEGPDRDGRIREILRQGPDWPEVLRQGSRHGVLPLVHTRLADSAAERQSPPPDVAAVLRKRYYETGRRNLRLTARLVEILRGLEEAGVQALPIKGAALAATVYENLALREFGDLDLLVRPSQVDRAELALRHMGLRPVWKPGPGQRAALRACWYATTWLDPRLEGEPDAAVDLHWRLAPPFFPFGLDADRLWSDTEEVRIHGRAVATLGPGMTLLGLCVHGAKHEPDPWSALKWTRDIAEVVRARGDLDWEALYRIAAEAGCARILSVGLALAVDALGLAPPEAARQRLDRDRTARELARRFAGRLFDAPTTTRLDRLRCEFRMRERARDRARIAIRRALLPNTRDLRSIRLPRPLSFLYVPLRLLRLAAAGVARPSRIRRFWTTPARKTVARV